MSNVNSVVLDYIHNTVHHGDYYQIGYYAAGVLNNANIALLIKNGIKPIHCVIAGSSGGDAIINVYEDPTITTNGTRIEAYNQNRSSTNIASGSYYHTPTISANGNNAVPPNVYIPGGSGGNSFGGSGGGPVRQGAELILAKNKNYYIVLQNIAGTAQKLNILVGFYEPY